MYEFSRPAFRRADSKYATHSPFHTLRSQPRRWGAIADSRSMNMRIPGVAVAALACVLTACAKKPDLNLYIWNDYLADDTIANFEKETGLKVATSNYGSNEELDSKLAPGKSGYDIVVPS